MFKLMGKEINAILGSKLSLSGPMKDMIEILVMHPMNGLQLVHC